MQNGVVLDRGTQRQAATPIEGAEDRRVVGLGAAAGEDHLTRPTAEHVGDIVASLVDRLANLAGEAMRTRRVGELLSQEWQHRRDRVGTHRCRRRVIEIGVAVIHGDQATPADWPAAGVVVEDDAMDGYTNSTYGDAFADIYDDWYQGMSDAEATVDILVELAAECSPLPVLELGVGTGRLAVPLAARGVEVVGLDSSAAMLARLAENDHAGSVSTCIGDMVDDQPSGPFALVFVAYNTFFNLPNEDRQQACFTSVAERLAPGGAFVIEAFVPEPRPGSSVAVHSMTADSVVLSVATHDDAAQTAQGQYIEFSESGGVRMRPWAIRYATVEQLDTMALAAGFHVAERWEDPSRAPFGADSPRHLSVYRKSQPCPPLTASNVVSCEVL
jgi:SAM-dependent methyltransferase